MPSLFQLVLAIEEWFLNALSSRPRHTGLPALITAVILENIAKVSLRDLIRSPGAFLREGNHILTPLREGKTEAQATKNKS